MAQYFPGGAQAGQLAAVVEEVAELLVPTSVLLEVTRRVMQQRGEDEARQVAAVLHQGQVVALDGALALSAAQLGGAHKIPLADSIIYATAKQYAATVWTHAGIPAPRASRLLPRLTPRIPRTIIAKPRATRPSNPHIGARGSVQHGLASAAPRITARSLAGHGIVAADVSQRISVEG